MTVYQQVKQNLAKWKGIEAALNDLREKTQDDECYEAYREAVLETRTISKNLTDRLVELEKEEPQYKGN
ncbi:hypothetical protein [Texcoconibacillus texcoconensis]|uniref:Septin family protein n=1 Tax=Texcoconibacillus texcoconensis TaxID=1095777 RepID=A0A840QNM7_9BACI|nr:hypothetical protein [Texcoconibacillus texcoconensis]MBB5172958.1 septin family protein [Texcoconibacillus texcoconensis]